MRTNPATRETAQQTIARLTNERDRVLETLASVATDGACDLVEINRLKKKQHIVPIQQEPCSTKLWRTAALVATAVAAALGVALYMIHENPTAFAVARVVGSSSDPLFSVSEAAELAERYLRHSLFGT